MALNDLWGQTSYYEKMFLYYVIIHKNFDKIKF